MYPLVDANSVAADADRHQVWSDTAVELLSGLTTPERLLEVTGSVMEFMAYLAERPESAKSEPTGGLIDAVAAAVEAVEAGGLSPEHANVLLVQLVTASPKSTTSLIGTAARLEAVRAIAGLLASTTTVALPDGYRPDYVPSLFIRRLACLPLVMTG